MSGPTNEHLYQAFRVGMAALATSLNSSFKLLQVLVAERALREEVAVALWQDIQNDARRSVSSSPDLSSAVDELLATTPSTFRP